MIIELRFVQEAPDLKMVAGSIPVRVRSLPDSSLVCTVSVSQRQQRALLHSGQH